MNDRVTGCELLAPAGDWEAMRAAVANGADAVYFGLSNFNARHRAANFTTGELPQVMRYLHDHNVRGYLAFNTLLFSDELPDAGEFIKLAASAGVDALIVQDLGLARLIHSVAPTLPIHGSTQMTQTESRGLEFLKKLGVQRVILARELSLDEVGRITSSTDLPVEVFVHGALCVAYSGQCLTSESLGGRSANRGQCAQACRLPYDLVVDGELRDLGDRAYLLSPQDLAAHDLVADLVKLGVCGLKIEGRLKSAHYVAAATQTYRAALDAALAGRKYAIDERQEQDLAQSFSRGFTHGFLDGPNHQALVHARFPKSRGIRVGTVVGRTAEGVVVRPDSSAQLKPGDGVVFDEGHPEQDEQGGRVFSVQAALGGDLLVSFARGDVQLAAIEVGSIVWKTDDPAIRKRLEHSYAREMLARRVRVDMAIEGQVGGLLQVTARSQEGHEAKVAWEQPLQEARKHPVSEALVREQFARLGQTPYTLGAVTLKCGPVMVPKSVLNDLRRRAIEKLLEIRGEQKRHEVAEAGALEKLREKWRGPTGGTPVPLTRVAPTKVPSAEVARPEAALCVLTRTMEQLQAVLDWRGGTGVSPVSWVYCDFEDIRRYAEAIALARAADQRIALATLHIVKPAEEGLLKRIADCGPDAVLVRNLAAVCYYAQNHAALPMIGDYSLNIANELTAGVFADAGLVRMVPSYDLNWSQLHALLGRFPVEMFEAVIHQHMPMFHMEHCVFAHTLSNGRDYHDCGRPCERHRVDLRDRVGQAHPLVPDVGCRNTLFNAAAQSAAEFVPRMRQLNLRYFRVELLRHDASETRSLLERYRRVLAGEEDARTTWRELRVVNQLGVTRGTLEYP